MWSRKRKEGQEPDAGLHQADDVHSRNDDAADWARADGEDDAALPRKSLISRILPVTAIAAGVLGVAILAATQGAAWISSAPQVEGERMARSAAQAMQPTGIPRTYSLASVGGRVGDASVLPSAGWMEVDPNWVLRSETSGVATRFQPLSGAAGEADRAQTHVVVSAPIPAPNPMSATQTPLVGPEMATAPLPLSHPLARSERQERDSDDTPRVASLGPAGTPGGEPAEMRAAPPEPEEVRPAPRRRGGIPSHTNVTLPTAGDRYAVYDITAQKVYMPNGDRLEAHSGYGEKFDDPRHVSVKMLGPTPPNTYRLTMRERPFHGVAALRMHPIGSGKMYGRDGFLTHSYLMGARGDSNGCISFKDYDRFLAYWKRGEITHMVVVASLPDGEKPEPKLPGLLSWLKPK